MALTEILSANAHAPCSFAELNVGDWQVRGICAEAEHILQSRFCLFKT